MKQQFEKMNLKNDLLIQSLIQIVRIASPTGRERKKISFIQAKLSSYGLEDVLIDSIGNCVAKLPSRVVAKRKKTILVVAHVDTACDVGGEEVKITQDAKYIYGHGVCDNSAGVNALLTTFSMVRLFTTTVGILLPELWLGITQTR